MFRLMYVLEKLAAEEGILIWCNANVLQILEAPFANCMQSTLSDKYVRLEKLQTFQT